MSSDLIRRGLQQRQRRAALAVGDTAKVEAIDKALAARPTAANDTARENQRRRLIGKGYDHLQGPEIAALRLRMAAAGSATPATPTRAKSAPTESGGFQRQAVRDSVCVGRTGGRQT